MELMVASIFKHVKSLKVILSNAVQFVNYANNLVDGVNVIYHDTEKLQYLLNTDEAFPLTGTRKVRTIKQIIKNNTIKFDFFEHSAEVEAFGNTTYSSTETLKDAEFNVEMHTESSSSNVLISTGSWYAAYLSKYKYWFVGRVLETFQLK